MIAHHVIRFHQVDSTVSVSHKHLISAACSPGRAVSVPPPPPQATQRRKTQKKIPRSGVTSTARNSKVFFATVLLSTRISKRAPRYGAPSNTRNSKKVPRYGIPSTTRNSKVQNSKICVPRSPIIPKRDVRYFHSHGWQQAPARPAGHSIINTAYQQNNICGLDHQLFKLTFNRKPPRATSHIHTNVRRHRPEYL